MASASCSSCSSRRRRRTSIPLILCPSCGVKQIVELTANTEANQGRIFFACPSHEKGGSGCDFWYWEEGYIKYLNRKGLIEQNTCAKLLNEANQREIQRGTEEIKLDADVKKKSMVQEIRKDADVEEFKQADDMLLILREMMVMMKLMLVGGVCSVGLLVCCFLVLWFK
uniref:GRF-type domain-containing protein n=1 Tax=Oryza barthii TaxID=65489 RepID=A0A0D3GPJ5_9ORYZ